MALEPTCKAFLYRTLLPAALIVGLSACQQSKQAHLMYMEMALRQECFGTVTNTCSDKNIDFDIEFIRSLGIEAWLPYKEAPTKQAMIEAFGDHGWTIFEQSAKDVLDQVIANLQARRPSFIARWFFGDELPVNGGIRAFNDADFLLVVKKQIEVAFEQNLQKSGWHPSEAAIKRYGSSSAPSP